MAKCTPQMPCTHCLSLCSWVKLVKQSEMYTAFYYRHTLLSNFPSSKFTCDGVDYLHSELYFHLKKAESNKYFERAREIMRTEYQLQCYKIGHNVSIWSKEEWEKIALDVTFDGYHTKFEQNSNLHDFLLSTRTRVLMEARPFDLFRGLGLVINHPNIFKPDLWPKGDKKWLGKILFKVRDHLIQT